MEPHSSSYGADFGEFYDDNYKVNLGFQSFQDFEDDVSFSNGGDHSASLNNGGRGRGDTREGRFGPPRGRGGHDFHSDYYGEYGASDEYFHGDQQGIGGFGIHQQRGRGPYRVHQGGRGSHRGMRGGYGSHSGYGEPEGSSLNHPDAFERDWFQPSVTGSLGRRSWGPPGRGQGLKRGHRGAPVGKTMEREQHGRQVQQNLQIPTDHTEMAYGDSDIQDKMLEEKDSHIQDKMLEEKDSDIQDKMLEEKEDKMQETPVKESVNIEADSDSKTKDVIVIDPDIHADDVVIVDDPDKNTEDAVIVIDPDEKTEAANITDEDKNTTKELNKNDDDLVEGSAVCNQGASGIEKESTAQKEENEDEDDESDDAIVPHNRGLMSTLLRLAASQPEQSKGGENKSGDGPKENVPSKSHRKEEQDVGKKEEYPEEDTEEYLEEEEEEEEEYYEGKMSNYCELCNVTASSAGCFRDHIRGVKHKRINQKISVSFQQFLENC